MNVCGQRSHVGLVPQLRSSQYEPMSTLVLPELATLDGFNERKFNKRKHHADTVSRMWYAQDRVQRCETLRQFKTSALQPHRNHKPRRLAKRNEVLVHSPNKSSMLSSIGLAPFSGASSSFSFFESSLGCSASPSPSSGSGSVSPNL